MSNNVNITFDVRCGHCNKKFSEITAPCTLMVQKIKCPRCKNMVEIFVLKETEVSDKVTDDKPKEPYNPVKEKPVYNSIDETKLGVLIHG